MSCISLLHGKAAEDSHPYPQKVPSRNLQLQDLAGFGEFLPSKTESGGSSQRVLERRSSVTRAPTRNIAGFPCRGRIAGRGVLRVRMRLCHRSPKCRHPCGGSLGRKDDSSFLSKSAHPLLITLPPRLCDRCLLRFEAPRLLSRAVNVRISHAH